MQAVIHNIIYMIKIIICKIFKMDLVKKDEIVKTGVQLAIQDGNSQLLLGDNFEDYAFSDGPV